MQTPGPPPTQGMSIQGWSPLVCIFQEIRLLSLGVSTLIKSKTLPSQSSRHSGTWGQDPGKDSPE